MSQYKLGYARVSTPDQDEALQHDALTAAGVDRIFTDKASGKLQHRPALDALLEQARPGGALGHAKATTTLNTYSHLWPTAEDRTRAAAGDLLRAVQNPPADRARTGRL